MSHVVNSQHFYTDSDGTYRVDKLFPYVNRHPEQHKELSIHPLLGYIVHDTLSDLDEMRRSNFRAIFEDAHHQERMKEVDIQYPIILDNFGHLVDGVHRLFRSIFENRQTVKVIFIDRKTLASVRIDTPQQKRDPILPNAPFEDIHLRIPQNALPENPDKRRNTVEEYFPDQLPSLCDLGNEYEVVLERPSSPYGSYSCDRDLSKGLQWWRPGTRVRDMPLEYRPLKGGLLALEEQWIPLSWSLAFQQMKKIPKELVLLHLDDHQDMMSPRIGTRLDGTLVDYITGDAIDFLDSESVKSAIISGAIGKGSILTPLIWAVEKIHVRHLCVKQHPNITYHLEKIGWADKVLFEYPNRLGLNFSDTHWDLLKEKSNYVVTDEIRVWLRDLPSDVPIFLHFDLDYFNNRFDGSSDWETDPHRNHDIRFSQQQRSLQSVFSALKKEKLIARIMDTSIGISPGFYPSEYWEPMVSHLILEGKKAGLDLSEVTHGKAVTPIKASKSPGRIVRKRKTGDDLKGNRVKISKATVRSMSSVPKSPESGPDKIEEHRVTVVKMSSKEFEGWKIHVDDEPCGYVKFFPKNDSVFKKHVTVDFKVPIPQQSRHIGRHALSKAIDLSKHRLFVAHLKKSNAASKKTLSAVGFTEAKNYATRQLCMIFRKTLK
jgi:hypothetical protein